jgi:hypothetical protein
MVCAIAGEDSMQTANIAAMATDPKAFIAVSSSFVFRPATAVHLLAAGFIAAMHSASADCIK